MEGTEKRRGVLTEEWNCAYKLTRKKNLYTFKKLGRTGLHCNLLRGKSDG